MLWLGSSVIKLFTAIGRCYILGLAPCLPTNMRLSWKGLPGTKTNWLWTLVNYWPKSFKTMGPDRLLASPANIRLTEKYREASNTLAYITFMLTKKSNNVDHKAQCYKTSYGRRHARDKHSSLLRKFVNNRQNFFYNMGPGCSWSSSSVPAPWSARCTPTAWRRGSRALAKQSLPKFTWPKVKHWAWTRCEAWCPYFLKT